jgi:hypothetical protein
VAVFGIAARPRSTELPGEKVPICSRFFANARSHPNESHAGKVSHLAVAAWELLAELLAKHEQAASWTVPPKLLVSLAAGLARTETHNQECLSGAHQQRLTSDNELIRCAAISSVLTTLLAPGFPFLPTTDHLAAAYETLLQGFFKLESEVEQGSLVPFVIKLIDYLGTHVSASTKRRKVG